jgi:membrane associated rhomboid family serine protease
MTWIIIIITCVISLVAFNRQDIFRKLTFQPTAIRYSREYYRFVSYALIHADFMHLGINMFVLYSFGTMVETYFNLFLSGKGNFYYVLLYLGGIIFSTLPSYGKHKDNPGYSAVGASGAVSAILFSSIIFNPLASLSLFLLPFSMPSVVFGLLYLVLSAYMARKGHDNIGHDAHFWGAIFGMVFTVAVEPNLFFMFIERIKMLF